MSEYKYGDMVQVRDSEKQIWSEPRFYLSSIPIPNGIRHFTMYPVENESTNKPSNMLKHLEIIEILEVMQVNEADLVAVLVACDYEATIYVKTDTPTADLLRQKYTFEHDPESKIERAEITAHHLDGNSYTFFLRIL